MTTTIKITELTNIGANLNGNTLVPVVNMNGTPVTQRSNVENLANYVLNTGTGANLGAVGNITITGGNSGEVLTTDGNGVLSWESSSATYSNSNVANYLPTYTGNITGDYIELTHDVNANVVYGNYLYGDGSNITNLPVGNISSINIDGNSSNVLYGNGVFDSVGSPFNQDLNTTDSVIFANITTTEAIRFRNSGNTVGAMGYAPTFLSIESYGSNSVQVTTNDLLTWSFDSEGILTFPEGTTTTGSSIETPAGDDFSITTSSITSVSAPCVIAVGDEFVADTEFNDDITVVQVGWTVSIDGTDYTVTYIDPSPPANQYRITAAGATFVQNTTYTFSDPVPATHNWTISEIGVLSTPGGGTISQHSDFIISVSGTDRIDLRTENGDAILDAEGNLNLTGNLVFSGGAIIDPTDNNFEVRGVQNVNFEASAVVNIYTDTSNNSYQWQFGDDGNLTLPDGSHIFNGKMYGNSEDGGTIGNATGIVQVYARNNGVGIQTYDTPNLNYHSWLFSMDGNLYLPDGDGISINYANGQPYGGGANIGNITVSDVTLQGVSGYSGGIQLSASPDDTANLKYLQVRSGDLDSHIHFDTGNNEAYDQYFGNDFKFLKLEAGAGLSGNVSIGTYQDGGVGQLTWIFDSDGNLTVPNSAGGVIKTVANGAIAITAINGGSDNPAQMMSWTDGAPGPDTIISAYSSNALIQSNVTGAINTWTFDNVGNLTLPGSLIATTASPAPVINGFSISNAISLSGGNLTTTGTITSTGKIGYSTGGTATQSGSGTSVTINQLTGKITMATRTYNDGDLEVFSLQCNKVENDDMVLIQSVDTVDCASFSVSAYPYTLLANTIRVHMRTTGNLGTYTPVLKFLIVKAPTS